MVFFTAGCIGALANSLVIWQFSQLGIMQAFHVAISPHLSAAWLYPRIVWGGLWGLLFLLPMMNAKLFAKGTLLSLFPTAVQLFVVFPMQTPYGTAGLGLGLLTPIMVLFFNFIWGVSAAFAIKLSR